MAEERSYNHEVITPVETDVPAVVETQDRGIFDFLGKKDEEKPTPTPAQAYAGEEALVDEFEKVQVSESKVEEEKIEEVKKESFLEKLHDDSSSSSSSDEEEGSEKKEKKKKKKGLKEKITGEGDEKKSSEEDTTVPIEKYEEGAAVTPAEEKKGFLDKIKEKFPGQKKTEEVAAVEVQVQVEETKEKKGLLEKIKEKLPGYHSKTEEEKVKEHGSD